MIRIAFAGFQHSHINSFYKLAESDPNTKIVAAYEADADARAIAEKDLGVHFTHANYDEMINNKDIDIIAIGDYYGAHGALAIKAMKTGKHVFVDKPLCTSLAELKQIETLSIKKNLKVGCLLNMRYYHFVKPVHKFIQEGQLGEVHAVFFSGQHPLNYGTRQDWYFEEGKHGGTINEIGIHGIDLVEYLTGLSMRRVICARCWNAYASEVPSFKDCGQFMVEMSNGAGLMADVSYSSPYIPGYTLPFYWRFTIWGTKGVIEFSKASKEIIIVQNGKPGAEFITLSDINTGNCLNAFLDEIAGRPTDINTKSVIRATRDSLLIQKYADDFSNAQYERI